MNSGVAREQFDTMKRGMDEEKSEKGFQSSRRSVRVLKLSLVWTTTISLSAQGLGTGVALPPGGGTPF